MGDVMQGTVDNWKQKDSSAPHSGKSLAEPRVLSLLWVIKSNHQQ